MSAERPPVVVTVNEPEAAQMLTDVLADYFAELTRDGDVHVVSIAPVDELRRGTVVYRVIQASRTVAAEHPDADLFLVTEDGSRWRLPPPAI